ncbi:aldo/keto reductase, partial [Enterococcus hirae]
QQHHTPIITYYPLTQTKQLHQTLFNNTTLQQITQQKNINITQLLLN